MQTHEFAAGINFFFLFLFSSHNKTSMVLTQSTNEVNNTFIIFFFNSINDAQALTYNEKSPSQFPRLAKNNRMDDQPSLFPSRVCATIVTTTARKENLLGIFLCIFFFLFFRMKKCSSLSQRPQQKIARHRDNNCRYSRAIASLKSDQVFY